MATRGTGRAVTILLIVTGVIILPLSISFNPKPVDAYHIQSITQLTTEHKFAKVVSDSSALYVAGSVPNRTGTTVHNDAFIRKYDTNVNEVWTKQFGTSANDAAINIALYSSTVYVVGFSEVSSTPNYFLSKFSSSNGNLISRINIVPPAGGSMEVRAVAVDSSGIYVAGTAIGLFAGQTSPPAQGGGASNAFVQKYDFNNNLIWTREFSCEGGEIYGRAVSVDTTGVYVVGDGFIDHSHLIPGAVAETTSQEGVHAFIRKYDKDGNHQWTRQFGYSAYQTFGTDVDSFSGKVYVTGGYYYAYGFVKAYDVNGNLQWVKNNIGAFNNGVDVDSSGIYFGGDNEPHAGGREDVYGIAGKLSPSGNVLWFRQVIADFTFSAYLVVTDVTVSAGSAYYVGNSDAGVYGIPSGSSTGGGAFILRIGTDNRHTITDFNGDGYADLAIGVPGEDLNTSTKVDAGAVNVIYGSSSGLSATSAKADQLWTQDSPYVEGASESGDRFGSSLAVGDFNHDGYSDLAIGAPNEAIGTVVNAGSVNVIYGSSAGLSATTIPDQIWTQDSNGIPDSIEAGDQFGKSLAVGDFNNDGYDDLAIGVPLEDIGSAVDAGAVNVIYGSSSGLSTSVVPAQFWEQNSAGVADSSETGDYFGWSLATLTERDGFDELVVGAYGEDNGSVKDTGAVYTIRGSPSGLLGINNGVITDTTSTQQGTAFGYSLAAGSFDINNFYKSLVIGEPLYDIGSATDAGRVWVNYQYWSQDTTYVEGAAEPGDKFGSSLAVGNFNGDAYSDLAIGAPGEAIGTVANAGSVNVIYGSSSGLSATVVSSTGHADQIWTQNTSYVEDSCEANDQFGYSLAVGDSNKDGRDDLAIGVPFEDLSGIQDAGAINLIYGSSTGLSATSKPDQLWSQNTSNVEDYNEKGDTFGWALMSG